MAKATNIVGENHKPYVSKQIQIRQEILGQSFRGSEELSWANSKTAWVRVVSSIDIADQQIPVFENAIAKDTVSNNGKEIKLKDLGLPNYPGGSALAKDMTLFAGTSKTSINDNGDVTGYSSNSSLRYGLATSDSTLPGISTSYGMGGTEFGLNAMPGIISFTTENVNKGALRISNISLRANNKKQFEYLETLYMRLGYTVLVEWGNSSYYKQNSNGSQSYISGIASQRSLSADFIQATPKNMDAGDTLIDYFYKKIEEYREESQGNYDALVGKVRNFNWSFNPDGSYIINVELVSYGDVIESISISELYSDTILEANPSVNPPTTKGIKLGTTVTEVNSSLEAFIVIASYIPPVSITITTSAYSNTAGGVGFSSPGNNLGGSILPIFKDYPSTKDPSDSTKEIIDKLNYDRSKTPSNEKIILGIAKFGQNQSEQKFIRLGDILDFINQKCLIYDAEKKNLIKIDTNPDTNIGYSNKYQISADPKRVLVLNKFAFPLEFDLNFEVNIFADQGEGLEQFHYPIDESKGQWYCKIMNLYFNTNFVLETLKGYLNKEENKIDLFSFIKSLLTSANQSLGSVNQFNLRLSEEHTLQIYDEVRPVGYESFLLNPEESYPLHVYGLSPSGSLGNSSNEGNFITSLNIKSELSKDFSTLVSIGAQSRGTAVGEDATFFSKWNYGLKDRIVPEKLDWNSLIHNENTQRAAISELAINYINLLKSYSRSPVARDMWFNDFDLEYSSKFLKAQRDFFQYFLSIDAQQNGTLNPTVGFLPINVSLTMDGLSGVRIFDTLTIDTRFLPKSYQSSLDFIIKTVKHSVDQSNKWNTYIETFAVPKSKDQNQATITPEGIQTALSNLVQSPNNTPNYFTSNNPVILDYYSNINNQLATLINPYREVDIDAILYGLNSSPYVQAQFREFFTRIQNELGGGNGFEIQINSAYRPLGRNKQAGGVKNSAHITGLAIDMQINIARPFPSISSTSPQTYVSNNVGDQSKWEATNIPSIAQELGITWGNIYQVNNKPDFVHFAIDGGESGAPTGQSATYNYVYIDNGNSYWGTGTNAGQLNAPTNNDRTNVTAYSNFASKWYNQLEQEFPTLSNIISTQYKSSVKPIWQADGLNVKDYIRVVESNGNVYFAVNPSFLKMNSAFLGQYPTQSTLKTTVKSGTIFNRANGNFFDVQQNLYAI